jgi:Ca-activated chloride channel family protein
MNNNQPNTLNRVIKPKKPVDKSLIVTRIFILIILLPIVLPAFINTVSNIKIDNIFNFESRTFRLLASPSTKEFEDDLKSFAKEHKFTLEIEYQNDLDMIRTLNKATDYDGVWISNSTWLYMLDNQYLVTNSKSIAIDPVVVGIKKTKAKELGFINKPIYNKHILNAIKAKKLNYVMTAVTKTNTGATAYLGFLNSLAGSPEVLTSKMLDDKNLINNMTAFFKGVERVSGDEIYLKEMFLNGKYEAAITYESTLIDINKELEKQNKETLYMVYPVDGVAINDMPFGYVERQQGKEDKFKLLQDYLRSKQVRQKMEDQGFRTWYGGVKPDASKESFKKEWGIDTNKYLIPLKYPSKKVMTKAFTLYANQLRKPANVIFCLDVSGSMYGDGISELRDAMKYILDYEQASKDFIQFTAKDSIRILSFNSDVDKISNLTSGNKTKDLISFVDSLHADGGTNIYKASIKAYEMIKNTNLSERTAVIILMTDGVSINDQRELKNVYDKTSGIPIYSITFGSASTDQLEYIANLTNGKVFDGKAGLTEAFTEVRSYS